MSRNNRLINFKGLNEMTLLERAAVAAQKADGAYRHENGRWMKEGGLVGDDHWLDIARAVIEAIREPNDALIEAMRETVPVDGPDWTFDERYIRAGVVKRDPPGEHWRAMLDAVLG